MMNTKQYIKNNKLIKYIYALMPFFMRKDYSYYKKIEELINLTEQYSKEELEKWQFGKLQEIVNYAWENIIGYQELWKEHNFEPSKLKSIKDINKIPFITKEILRDNIEKFTNKNLPNIRYVTTGGSTGAPFGFYEQSHNNMIEWAFITSLWGRFYKDIKPDSKRVTLRGNRIDNIYEYDPRIGLVISSYDINKENVKVYIQQIEKYKLPIFHVYPSAIYLMAKVMKDNNIKLNHKFKAIMFGSEALYDFQKELINEVFNTKLCYWYGHTEKVILAGNCEGDNRFYSFPQYGLMEVIHGELVGTSFWNYATPLIRYKTMDYANLEKDKVKLCQLNYPILNKIEGRLQDYIVNKESELVTLTALIFAQHFNCFSKIIQMQLYQDTVGEVIVKIIPSQEFNKIDEKEIIDKMLNASHNKIIVIIKIVSIIEKTKAGKLRFLDQKLDMKEFI